MNRLCVPDVLLKVYSVKSKIKKLYEDVNLKKNKPSAEHQGNIINSLKSFAAIQNLVRLSL